MADASRYDAVVVGGVPNGLAAAITIAQAGRSVALFEAKDVVGGGVHSALLTLPNFIHDVCSAVYPLALGSPFFRTLPLAQYGLDWIHSPTPLAHPLDDGTAVVLAGSIDATAAGLDGDAQAYQELFGPLARQWNGLDSEILAPPHWPRHVFSFARFGIKAIQSARRLAEARFRSGRARALFAGLAAHAMLPLEYYGSAAFGLVLGVTAHVLGWPIVRGGAQRLADALSAHLRFLGGEIFLNRPILTLEDLPEAHVILCDVTARQLLAIASKRLPAEFRGRLEKFRYGMGAFKMDWALSCPVPWKAAACRQAATIHLGGTLEEIATAERAVWEGRPSTAPFVLLAQPSLFD